MNELPGQMNRAASPAYQQLTPTEREELKQQTEQMQAQEKKMSRKDVVRTSDKFFSKIQKLVYVFNLHCLSFNESHIVLFL